MATKKTSKKRSAKGTAKKAASSRGATGRAAGSSNDGFRAFSMHVDDPSDAKVFNALRAEQPSFAGFAVAADIGISNMDPETVARQYLQHSLASDATPSFTAPEVDGQASEFKSIDTQTVPLTNTKIVKFRQTYNKIPVYNSLVSIELDQNNQCLAINSNLGTPSKINPVAKLAPAEALKKALERAGSKSSEGLSPRLNYYFDDKANRWRLVYFIEDVPFHRQSKGKAESTPLPLVMDYFIDAHTGAVVAEVPGTPTADQFEIEAVDGLGQPRRIRFAKGDGGQLILRDDRLNIATYDFGFGDPSLRENLLPGNFITNPPAPWVDGAVSAHANAAAVADFLRNVVKRNNIDDRGGTLVSTVNCVVARFSPDGRQWLNAFWTPRKRQMVYGQTLHNGNLRSLAVHLDIVGHEMFHGVTDSTSALEYRNQSGALNESYSDIFGILIANSDKPDIGQWRWELGPGLGRNGGPLRDLSRPSRCGQPETMNQYRNLPSDETGDYGGVHVNSGIHNFAAYKIITSRNAQRGYVFTLQEVAAMFYIALVHYLTPSSNFSASRRGITLAARTLFRNDPQATQQAKIRAIGRAFNAVGVQ